MLLTLIALLKQKQRRRKQLPKTKEDTSAQALIRKCLLLAGASDVEPITSVASSIIYNIGQNAIPNQLLAVACVLIAMEEKYGIKVIEAINAAEVLKESVEGTKLEGYFKVLHQFMLNEWNVNEQREEKEING